jgi:hypothetical protein
LPLTLSDKVKIFKFFEWWPVFSRSYAASWGRTFLHPEIHDFSSVLFFLELETTGPTVYNGFLVDAIHFSRSYGSEVAKHKAPGPYHMLDFKR